MRTIDLAYPIHAGMFKYPSDSAPEIKITKSREEKTEEIIFDESGFSSGAAILGIKYSSGYIDLNIRNHHGTHIDFPSHKIQNGKTQEAYGLEKFTNQAFLLDATNTDILKRKEKRLLVKDFDKLLNYQDRSGIGAVILYTGFSDEITKFEGKLQEQEKTEFEKTFPYLSEELAEDLIKAFPKLNIIGIDSFSLDRKGSNSEVHRMFLERDILPLETLVNIKELKKEFWNQSSFLDFEPSYGFLLHSIPISILHTDAAPVRAYAQI
jgi:kynurenine formamidase